MSCGRMREESNVWEHAEAGESDVNNRKCVSCNLFIVARSPWLCSYCNPSSKKTTKEKTVVDFFHEQKMEFVHNKSIGVVCGNYRPDLLFDAITHFLVVEIDEDQHSSMTQDDRYGNICERIRENNIYIALGLPTVFLRYNPDSFKIEGKPLRLKKETRLRILLDRVQYHFSHVPEKPITVEFSSMMTMNTKTRRLRHLPHNKSPSFIALRKPY